MRNILPPASKQHNLIGMSDMYVIRSVTNRSASMRNMDTRATDNKSRSCDIGIRIIMELVSVFRAFVNTLYIMPADDNRFSCKSRTNCAACNYNTPFDSAYLNATCCQYNRIGNQAEVTAVNGNYRILNSPCERSAQGS